MASPVMTAMRRGSLVRIEELTRIPADVQDALIMILSEKTLPIPELGTEIPGGEGIQPDRDRQRPGRGQRASSALRRRFNASCFRCRTEEDEVTIVATRVADLSTALQLPKYQQLWTRSVAWSRFSELRSGVTKDGRTRSSPCPVPCRPRRRSR